MSSFLPHFQRTVFSADSSFLSALLIDHPTASGSSRFLLRYPPIILLKILCIWLVTFLLMLSELFDFQWLDYNESWCGSLDFPIWSSLNFLYLCYSADLGDSPLLFLQISSLLFLSHSPDQSLSAYIGPLDSVHKSPNLCSRFFILFFLLRRDNFKWLVFKVADSFFCLSSLLLNPARELKNSVTMFFSSRISLWFF